MAEQALVAKAKAGDQQAFAALYQDNLANVKATVRRYVKRTEDVDDVVQHAFTNAFLKLSSFRGDSQFSTWLFRIATNCGKLYLRRDRSAMFEPLDCFFVESSERGYNESQRRQAVNDDVLESLPDRVELAKAVETLPDGYRRAFIEKAIGGYEHNEIAERHGTSVGCSKSQYDRARRSLRKVMRRRGTTL